MAVIVKYIVVRNGEEKMTFATKKEADAYDKMLDIADNLFEFLESSKIKLNENQLEDISLLLAEKRDKLMPILRGIKPNKKAAKKSEPKKPESKESAPQKTKAQKK
ncbi:MAG: YebG family protein [Deltaproteobacteria bacterium]|nr:YebG family protein [Deltaproteobacteria bacterium]